MPSASAACPQPRVHTHTLAHGRTLTSTRTAWQGHLPAQDIPISTLPPPDHHSPTRCVTHTQTHTHTHSPDESHASSVSQQGEPGSICRSRDRSCRWEAPLTVRERIITAVKLPNHRQTQERWPHGCVFHTDYKWSKIRESKPAITCKCTFLRQQSLLFFAACWNIAVLYTVKLFQMFMLQ